MQNIMKIILIKFRNVMSGLTFEEKYRLRIQTLIDKGLKLGKNVTIDPSVAIDSGYPYLINIGDNCSIATGVRLLAHDDTPYKFTGGYARVGQINIKDNCFIGENAIILPGVTIGPNVIVASGSVVNKNIAPNSCVAGVPARFYAKFDEYVENNNIKISERPVFKYSELRTKEISAELINKVIDSTKDDICYVYGKYGTKYNYTYWNTD